MEKAKKKNKNKYRNYTNHRRLKWESSQLISKICKISDIIKDIGTTRLISDPTHFTKNSESILHMLFVNDSENINFLGWEYSVLSSTTRYHFPVYCFLQLPKSYSRTFTRKIWSFAETNLNDYKLSLQNQDLFWGEYKLSL